LSVQLPEKRILIKYNHLHRAESFLEAITRNTKQKEKLNSYYSTKRTRDTKSIRMKGRISVQIIRATGYPPDTIVVFLNPHKMKPLLKQDRLLPNSFQFISHQ